MNWKKSVGIFLLLGQLSLGYCPKLAAQNADIELLRRINLDRNKDLDPGFRFVTNTAGPFTVGIPLALVVYQLYHKDSVGNKKALFVCTTTAMAAIISVGMKYAIHRPRPFVTYPEIEKETVAGSLSFPSGHSSSAFSLATSLSMAYPKWYIVAPSFIWAGTVAYSRMDLGAHYPSDVLAGILIGSGSAFLSYKINDWLYPIPKKKKKGSSQYKKNN